MIRIVRAAIDATLPGGVTDDYFRKYGEREGPLRHRFAAFQQVMAQNPRAGRDLAPALFHDLNDLCHGTGVKVPDYTRLVRVMTMVIKKRDWWNQHPPRLFERDRVEVEQIADVVPEILARIKDGHDEYTYSLVTRILHFIFPETFAIIDSRAARSIERWSDDAHRNIRLSMTPRLQFRATALTAASGKSYPDILSFYRRFWNYALLGNLLDELGMAADRMEQMLRRLPRATEARISTLDVLDKLLNRADGNGRILGLSGS